MTGPGVRMPTAEGDEKGLRAAIRGRLADTRSRTLDLLEAMDDERLYGQPEPTMGVPAWDLGHIACFEHRWLVDELGGERVDPERLELFDPIEHPRCERSDLDLPSREQILEHLDEVRSRGLSVLGGTDLADGSRLVRDGFVHDMVVRHEDQHRETVLVTLQMFGGEPDPGVERQPGAFSPPERQPRPEPSANVEGTVEVPASTFELGLDPHVGTYDNEWRAHEVDLDAFEIDRAPVTNGEFRQFVEDGGYEGPQHWSEDGWMIQEALEREHPKYWTNSGDEWYLREADRVRPLPEDQPVTHVSFYEAQAYANWAGKRIPTEAEWEAAAAWDPERGTKHRFPWGDEPWTAEKANLGQRTYGPAPVGAYPEGASSVGCYQMCGDVWEWTSTVFDAYPGFEAFPYPEYSEEHFGRGFRVLRGGSWATMPSCAHATFRNWHQPEHQQIFAGFRCARDRS